jgi:hypothetical protein
MPKLIAYHPSIVVEADKQKYQIVCRTDDWYPDEEVVAMLHSAYGTKSPKELVAAIGSGIPDRDGLRATVKAVV